MGYFICGLIGTSILVAKAYLITNYSARNVSVKIANVVRFCEGNVTIFGERCDKNFRGEM